jgi:hypothetical protein
VPARMKWYLDHNHTLGVMDIEAFGSSKCLHSFTPVRRRESTVNSRQFQGDQEQEWTAARCHRLLRALTSRVAILKKELARLSSVPQNDDDSGQQNAPGRQRAAHARVDENWVRARKRIRQTYSKKSIRNERGPQRNVGKAQGSSSTVGWKALLPGEIAVPTPILARARGELPTEEPLTIFPDAGMFEEPIRRNKRARTKYMTSDGDPQFQLSELLELRKRITAARYTTYEGIYSGLEALLRATTKTGAEPSLHGPNSLLSMALRAIPRYITQQEALLRAHMEETGSKSTIENRDISTEIYDELETFGSSGPGWKQLRIIVRSHGIQVVSDAICAGLLDVEFSGALITLCVNTSAIEEAETLLSALLTVAPCPGPKTPYDIPSRPFIMLRKFTEHTGRSSFEHRQLSVMVAHSILPVEWLATKEFGPVWTRVIHSLLPNLDNTEALRLLDLTLTMLSVDVISTIRDKSGAITEAVRNTFSSLLTTLSSVVILSREAVYPSPTKEAGSPREYGHVSSLLQSCLVHQSHRDPTHNYQSPLLVLANLLVQDEREISVDSNELCVNSLEYHLMRGNDYFVSASAVYRNVVDFICLVARCCGRGASSSGFEHLERLHRLIESFIHDPEEGNPWKGLIVDSAFVFAQQVPDRKHLDYATFVEEKFCARRYAGKDSLLAASAGDCEEVRSGFRWEEGIGEWVTATPAIHLSRKSVVEVLSTTDSEIDTPFRLPQNLRRGKHPMKETGVDLPSLSYNDTIDEYSNMSDSSMQTSNGEFGEAVASDDELARRSQRSPSFQSNELIASPSDVEASSIEKFLVSNNSSPLAGRHEAFTRAPRFGRRLFRNSQDWNLFDDSSVSSASSLLQNKNNDSKDFQRNYVNRAPRLGRRALRSSPAWQIFDESADELSFLSVSSQGQQTLHDITNTAVSSAGYACVRRANPPPIPKKLVPSQDSEDELCI